MRLRLMKRTDFTFDLPSGLIAQQPLSRRSDSRMLHLSRETGAYRDCQFADLSDFLHPNDLLVFNNTRVIPARIHGHKESGGKVEVLVERFVDRQKCLAQIRASKSPKAGTAILLEDGTRLEVAGREGEFYLLTSAAEPVASLVDRLGHMPLPPYIERADTKLDQERYQTVYAERPGAVAAPTAGLHFDHVLLRALEERGVEQAYVTLHVGAGTFQPVRADHIEDHVMHAEYLEVSDEVCEAVEKTRGRSGRVIAVGTTSVRSLETAAQAGSLMSFEGDSRIFIYPGYEFCVVDGMITNFHLPESTLLMLVSAFAGTDPVLKAYAHAVQEKYRFFSYGDAMLII